MIFAIQYVSVCTMAEKTASAPTTRVNNERVELHECMCVCLSAIRKLAFIDKLIDSLLLFHPLNTIQKSLISILRTHRQTRYEHLRRIFCFFLRFLIQYSHFLFSLDCCCCCKVHRFEISMKPTIYGEKNHTHTRYMNAHHNTHSLTMLLD